MKPKTIGIIGAENSHSWTIAALCNIQMSVPLRVTHLWGETREFAEEAAKRGRITTIVDDWKSLYQKVDAVAIAHRDGREHSTPAAWFIERKVPTFIDKPMTCSLKEALSLFSLADFHSCPLLTFSSKPLQQGFQSFADDVASRGRIAAFHSNGPTDIDSIYGGIFYYGIHQVDCALEVMGTEVRTASVVREGDNGVAILFFKGGGVATINLLKNGEGGFHWTAFTESGIFSVGNQRDPVPHLVTTRILSEFVHAGNVPFSRERMLMPIAVLEALNRSLYSGRPERVPSLTE